MFYLLLLLLTFPRHDIADSLEQSFGSMVRDEARKQLLFQDQNSFEEFVREVIYLWTERWEESDKTRGDECIDIEDFF